MTSERDGRFKEPKLVKVVHPVTGDGAFKALDDVRQYIQGTPIPKDTPPPPHDYLSTWKPMPMPDNIGEKFDHSEGSDSPQVIFLTSLPNVTLKRLGTRNLKPVYWIGETDTVPDILDSDVMCVTDDVTGVHLYSAVKRTSVKRFTMGAYTIFYLTRSYNGFSYIVLLQALFELKYFGKVCNKDDMHCGNSKIRVLEIEGECNEDEIPSEPQVIIFDCETLSQLKLPSDLHILIHGRPPVEQEPAHEEQGELVAFEEDTDSNVLVENVSDEYDKRMQIIIQNPGESPIREEVDRGSDLNVDTETVLKSADKILTPSAKRMVSILRTPNTAHSGRAKGQKHLYRTRPKSVKEQELIETEHYNIGRSGRKIKLKQEYVDYMNKSKVHVDGSYSSENIVIEIKEEPIDVDSTEFTLSDALQNTFTLGKMTQKRITQPKKGPPKKRGRPKKLVTVPGKAKPGPLSSKQKSVVKNISEKLAKKNKVRKTSDKNNSDSDEDRKPKKKRKSIKKKSKDSVDESSDYIDDHPSNQKWKTNKNHKNKHMSDDNGGSDSDEDIKRKTKKKRHYSSDSSESEYEAKKKRKPKKESSESEGEIKRKTKKAKMESSESEGEIKRKKKKTPMKKERCYNESESDEEESKRKKNRKKKTFESKSFKGIFSEDTSIKVGDDDELIALQIPKKRFLKDEEINTETTTLRSQSYNSGSWTGMDVKRPSEALAKARLWSQNYCQDCLYNHKPEKEGASECHYVNPKHIIINPEQGSNNCTLHSVSTLPTELSLRISPHTHKLGVYSFKPIKRYTQFGPLVGILMTDKDITAETDFSHLWILRYEEEGQKYFLNTSEENASNWCRYLQYGLNTPTNMVMVLKDEGIFFVSSRNIEEGELLRIYIPYFGNKSRPLMKTFEIQECLTCKKVFDHPIDFQKHFHVFHPYKMVAHKQDCTVCQKTFFSLKELHLHCKQEHEGRGAYECHICLKVRYIQRIIYYYIIYHAH